MHVCYMFPGLYKFTVSTCLSQVHRHVHVYINVIRFRGLNECLPYLARTNFNLTHVKLNRLSITGSILVHQGPIYKICSFNDRALCRLPYLSRTNFNLAHVKLIRLSITGSILVPI